MLKLQVKKMKIQLLERNGEVYLEEGFLIEGNGLCAIYAEGYFEFVCTADYELGHILEGHNLTLKEL